MPAQILLTFLMEYLLVSKNIDCVPDKAEKCEIMLMGLLDLRSNNKEENCRTYVALKKCIVKSGCSFGDFSDHLVYLKDYCENHCDISNLEMCREETKVKFNMNVNNLCVNRYRYNTCYRKNTCKLVEALNKYNMDGICDPCNVKSYSCRKLFSDVTKVKHDKKKICSIFKQAKHCLEEINCFSHRFNETYQHIKRSCEGECELTSAIQCKEKTKAAYNRRFANRCQKLYEYRDCYEKADCPHLVDLNNIKKKDVCKS